MQCSNHWIPYVSDLEYDHLINNTEAFKEQIIVVCVSSSQRKDPSEDEIEQLYERQNKHRIMPSAQVGFISRLIFLHVVEHLLQDPFWNNYLFICLLIPKDYGKSIEMLHIG